MHPEFEAVIGLEVHCQLSTRSKLFCGSKSRLEEGQSVADERVNANTSPIDAGHPGTLPVLNRQAVEYAIRAGLALNCRINRKSVFARKNYFYPDLPKGYQISQYDQPLCEHGWLEVRPEKEDPIRVSIQRIHMEEDAGKNVHMSGYSLVNLNRAGTPLIEIVTGPDMRTAAQAGAYLRALHQIVTYIGITDGNMQEGNFRCDANVSVRRKGAKEFGTRAEVKNVNSFRFIEKAIEFEIARQIGVVQSGGRVIQETRGYDSAKNITISQRSKEEANDYRYFPEPDLPPLIVSEQWVEKVRKELPELPAQRRDRYATQYGLTEYDATVLTASKSLAGFFDRTLDVLEKSGKKAKEVAKPVANLLAGEVSRLLNEEDRDIQESALRPEHVADLVNELNTQSISNSAAKQILAVIWKEGGKVSDLIDRLGLRQVSDVSSLEPAVEEVIAKFPQQAADFRAGKDKLLGFFVGNVMKATGGKANPAMIQELVKKKLQS